MIKLLGRILFLHILITYTHPQFIQIHDVTNNAGALILQRGEGRIIAGFDRLLHIIDFTQFEVSISILENVIGQMRNTSSDFSEIIKMKLREIRFMFNTLHVKPYKNKRSINFLGSAIKYVTGNLDAEDLEIINSDLEQLRKGENSMIKQNNRQIKINTKFENRINLVNSEIRNQQNNLNKISNNTDYIISETQKISIIFQIDSFLETLRSIEYSIMLAKLNIISKQILTPKEIETIAQELLNQGIETHDLHDANSYLTTSVIYKGSTLIISVNIPKLLPSTFRRVSIEPLPLHNRTMKLAYNTVFINSEQIFGITSQCRQTNKLTICERKQLIEISDNVCEAPLVRGNHGKCHFVEKTLPIETRTIDPGMLLVITVHQDVTINSTCGTNNKKLTGVHLIIFHNCSLFVNKELYENFEHRFYQPTILPLHAMQIQPLHVERNINLSELHEFNLKNRQYLETVDFRHRIGLASLSSFTILMIAVFIFGLFKYTQSTGTGNCSGRAISKRGRVKREVPTSSSDSNAPAPNMPTSTSTQIAMSAVSPDIGNTGSATRIANVTSNASLPSAKSAIAGQKPGTECTTNLFNRSLHFQTSTE